MKKVSTIAIRYSVVLLLIVFMGCEKDFNIDVKPNVPILVVEAYINNLLPEYNYVILSRSQNYYAPDFQSLPVSAARVSVTQGVRLADFSYQWDETSKIQMTEMTRPGMPSNFSKGVYFDSRLLTAPADALKGIPGKQYRLDIETSGKKYTAIASLLTPVTLDSVNSAYKYIDDEDSSKAKARLTINYLDPDTLGNNQMYYWRSRDNRNNFGWGGLARSRRTTGTDELTNGQYIRLTQPQGYLIGDTVNYYLVSINRLVFNFWDSFNKARNNSGPFSTSATLLNTIDGENVTGCFSGYSISTKTFIIK